MSDPAQLLVDHLDIWTGATLRKSGSGRGNGGKISLYGIDKLRSLILDLAVRGKLVPQDPADGDAEELLKRIKRTRTELEGQKRAQKIKALRHESLTEISTELPASWALAKLADLTCVITDGTHHTPQYIDDGIAFISVKDIDGKSVSFDDCKYISNEEHRAINSRCNPERNDILLCRIGTLGRATIVDTDRPFSLFVSVGLLKYVQEGYFPRYHHLALSSPLLSSQFEIIKAGGSHTNKLNLGDLPSLEIPLPPLAEQKRIVAKVDELMALVDALEAGTRAGMEAHETLVRELLATLVNSQDADDLAQNWSRIEAHFDTLFTTEASIDALKQTMVDLAIGGKFSADQAPNWPHRPLGDFVAEVSAGWSPKCIETPRSDDKWGVLKVSAVTWGEFRPDENKELPGNLEPRPEIEVKSGDFLISRANTADLVARSVVVPADAPAKLMMSDKIIRFRFKRDIDADFVNLIHDASYARGFYAAVAGGTSSSMKNVSQSQIKSLQIPVPPLAEQRRIVSIVESFAQLCEHSKAGMRLSTNKAVDLADALTMASAT